MPGCKRLAGVAEGIAVGHFRFTYPDGKKKAGAVRHFAAFTDLPDNLSKKRFEAIAVEFKG